MSSESHMTSLSITRASIVDLVASYLQGSGLISEKRIISNIQFGELFGASDVEHVPLKIFYEHKEVGADTKKDG